MKKLLLIALASVALISCDATMEDEELNECIEQLVEKGHTEEEARDICEMKDLEVAIPR